MLEEDRFLVLSDKVQYQQALTNCRSLKLSLIKIEDEEENVICNCICSALIMMLFSNMFLIWHMQGN